MNGLFTSGTTLLSSILFTCLPLLYFHLAERILFHCNGGCCSFVRVSGCRADIKPVLLCPRGAAGVSAHQIFPLICFFLHLSVGPALICAVDGGKGPQTEREWSPRCIEGWEQKACHRHSPLVSRRNSLIAILVAVGCYLPFTHLPPFAAVQAIIRSRFSCFLFPLL